MNILKYLSCVPLILFVCSCSSDSEETIDDTIPPQLDISLNGISDSSPEETPVIGNQLVINVSAEDASGIQKIEAFIDNNKVAEDRDAPFQLTIDLSGFSSKIGLASKYKDYILRVNATDNEGNVASKEQIINIDNELPTISDVSLEKESVIGGDTNPITFNVVDNEELDSVKVYINNELLIEISDGNYEININTNLLVDGDNTLKIEAIDLAKNIASYDVIFYVDNTGPEITFQNIDDGQVVDESIMLDPIIKDDFSEIVMVEYLIDGEVIYQVDQSGDFKWDLDSNAYETGIKTISLRAMDELGNSNLTEISIEILRRLIVINFPQGFYNPEIARLFVFASDMEGKLLDNQRVYPETEKIILRTSENISDAFEYMLTFAEYISFATANSSTFTTVANISNLSELNLRIPTQTYALDTFYFPAVGFDSYDSYNSFGHSRLGGGDLRPGNEEFRFTRNYDALAGLQTNKIYVLLNNLTLDTFSYAVFDWDLSGISEIRSDMFTEDGFVLGTSQTDIPTENIERIGLTYYGYFDENDFQNDIWHIDRGIEYQAMPNNKFNYYYNGVFYKRKYELTINDNFITGTGSPDELHSGLDWSIDYTFEDKTFNFSTSGLGHYVGKIIMLDDSNGGIELNGKKVNYYWTVAYDSQNQNVIKLPEIPQEIQSWDFYTFYEQNQLYVSQLEIRKYEGIQDYKDYLEKLIKNNKYRHLVSPKMEAVYLNPFAEEYFKYFYFKGSTNSFLID